MVAGDGTFRTAPGKRWKQVYALHAQIAPCGQEDRGRFVPVLAAFFSSDPTTTTFLTMFSAISDWLGNNLGKRWTPKLFLTDFSGLSNFLRYFEKVLYDSDDKCMIRA